MPRPRQMKEGRSRLPRWRATTEPKLGETPPGPSSLPVSAMVPAGGWVLLKFLLERIRVKRSLRAASFGRSSVKRMPDVRVGMVVNGPRYSAGALGLGSKVSRWLGAPQSQSSRTELARGDPELPAWAA